MASKIWKHISVLAVNITILAILIGSVEAYFRVFEMPAKTFTNAIFAQRHFSYMTFLAGSSGKKASPIVWRDIWRNKNINATHKRNNVGFRTDETFDFARIHRKKDNEKIIIFTGGSTVHGVGASSNQNVLAAVTETILNRKQDRFSYRVINMGMGGWIAFQQYLALGMWGKWYNPDWIVVMDGWNDIAVACAHSQGASYPMHFRAITSYIDGYLTGQTNPSFYRGSFENWLIRMSAAYRSISGKQYVPKKQYLVRDEGYRRVAAKVTWQDIERQIIFYLHSQELVLNLSEKTNYILSIQPIAKDYSQMFASKDTLSRIKNNLKDKKCGLATFQVGGLAYFLTKSEQGLKNLVARYSDRRNVKYLNMNNFFPLDFYTKWDYLIDRMHLNDLGHRVVAEIYAAHILAHDLGGSERYFGEMRDALEEIIGQPLPTHEQLAKARGEPFRFSAKLPQRSGQ